MNIAATLLIAIFSPAKLGVRARLGLGYSGLGSGSARLGLLELRRNILLTEIDVQRIGKVTKYL
jgi:hypothetical protein